jgi:translocation and assembly module TamA
VQRLAAQAPDNLRELLATQGLFAPKVTVRIAEDTPGATRPRVLVTVEPGPPTVVRGVDIRFAPTREGDTGAAALEQQARADWPLASGEPFTQSAWDGAKGSLLRQLTERRYPLARLSASLADIDPEAHAAHLRLDVDLGPPVTLGEIRVTGAERYPAENAVRLARLAGLAPGQVYALADLQAAQQRLAESGYYDAAFVFVDTAGPPDAAPVVLQLRESLRQKLVLGIGASTNSGPRLSLEHVHHNLPGLGWRATTKLRAERDTPLAEVELASPVDDQGWRWTTGALAQREQDDTLTITSQRLRAGRSFTTAAMERSFFLQYDRSRTDSDALRTLGLSPTESSVSANYAWTRRRFDTLPFARQGTGLAVELGLGLTLGASEHLPYLRGKVRWQQLTPLGDAGRLALRLEGGAVWAADRARIPATQRFLAGGDTSVRGYGIRELGIAQADGSVLPGRYLGVASVEWQRPLRLGGQPSDWEHTVFIDAGSVADRPADLRPKYGVGTGVRYNSPVGPLQLDLAYGLDVKRWRIHLSVGLTF